MRDSIFKSTEVMPEPGNKDVVRTAMTHVEKRNDPIILGEKTFLPHSVEHVPLVHRGKHY